MKNSDKNLSYAHGRGKIQENAIKALVTDKLFSPRVEHNKKGRGSYRRNEKHRQALSRGESPFKMI